MRALAVLALLTVASGGCHLIAGYDPASAAGDGSEPGRDGFALEAGGKFDGGAPLPDAIVEDSLSFAERANCTGTPTAPADDGDLLYGDRDPEPTVCNRLVPDVGIEGPWEFKELQSGFWKDTLCIDSVNGQIAQSCETQDNTEYFARLTTLPVGSTEVDYLLEATVVLDAAPAADSYWKVDVLSRFDWPAVNASGPYSYMSCGITDFPEWPRPDMHIELRRDSRDYSYDDYAAGGVIDAWNPNSAPTFSVNTNYRYQIQLHYRPKAVSPMGHDTVECRLFDELGRGLRDSTFKIWDTESRGYDFHAYLPDGPASIGLRVINIKAHFEDVQVFELYRGQ